MQLRFRDIPTRWMVWANLAGITAFVALMAYRRYWLETVLATVLLVITALMGRSVKSPRVERRIRALHAAVEGHNPPAVLVDDESGHIFQVRRPGRRRWYFVDRYEGDALADMHSDFNLGRTFSSVSFRRYIIFMDDVQAMDRVMPVRNPGNTDALPLPVAEPRRTLRQLWSGYRLSARLGTNRVGDEELQQLTEQLQRATPRRDDDGGPDAA